MAERSEAARSSRQTRQGQAVMNVVLSSDNFRSAQDIHAQLRATGDTVGLTTVYRHLALLTEEGQLDALQTADGGLLLSFQFASVKPSVLIVAISFGFYVIARIVGPFVTASRRNRSIAPELAELSHG